MIAGKVMSTNLVSLTLDATVKDAVRLFREYALQVFPVLDHEGKPVGIVSARSILHFALPGYASGEMIAVMGAGPDIKSVYKNLKSELDQPIRDVMNRNIETISASMPISAVAAMLINLKSDIHGVLVIDDAGKLTGIISARDIICSSPG
ncbi:MAG: HPP family protein [Mariprofundaceae bacterium]